jgi:4-diphosphocytidyl-2-C-methyl-D-erythritol kinase
MNKIIIDSDAKINLSIDILGFLENGYHKVEMLMRSITLYDRITIFKNDGKKFLYNKDGIYLTNSNFRLPRDERNLSYQAAKLFKKEAGIKDTINIFVEKHIPVGGGLGGGSADAAGVLVGLNKIYGKIYTREELAKISSRLGSDVPFLILGGTMLASGSGTELRPIYSSISGWLLIVNPGIFISTEKIYKAYDDLPSGDITHPDTKALINALEAGDTPFLAKNMRNVLEYPAFEFCPEIKKIKDEILSCGALGALMSGSGSTVFGIFNSQNKASAAMNRFRKMRFYSIMCRL